MSRVASISLSIRHILLLGTWHYIAFHDLACAFVLQPETSAIIVTLEVTPTNEMVVLMLLPALAMLETKYVSTEPVCSIT